jgi:2-oxoisovalerate dehydrogenase E1 component alpha subunit
MDLPEETLREMFYHMVLGRTIDERMWVLQRQGQVAFHISGMGQEGIQIGAAYAMDRSKDFLVPYYRDHSLVLAWGMTPRELMLALFARKGDPSSGGRQMPAHYGHRKLRIVSESSPVATQIPQAVGIALANKMRGEDAVTLVCFGDGATSKGDFHEGLNFAAVDKAPVIFLCQNNQFAISLPQSKQMAIENVADRAPGYGMPGVTVDGNDVLAVYRAVKEAADRARAGGGPTLVEAKTYRIVPHSSDDDDRLYRSREEVERWKKKGPIIRFRKYLREQGILSEDEEAELMARAVSVVDDATEFARQAPFPDLKDAVRPVYYGD